jgi:hypothetical protein
MTLKVFYLSGNLRFWYVPISLGSALPPIDMASEMISATCTQHARKGARCAWLRPTRHDLGLGRAHLREGRLVKWDEN